MSVWSWLRARLLNETPWIETSSDARWRLYGDHNNRIRVVLDVHDNPGAPWLEHIAGAVRWWNARLPREVLEGPTMPGAFDVQRIRANPHGVWALGCALVVADNEDDRKAHTYLYPGQDGLVEHALVPVPRVLPSYEQAREIARHELGHVLGLGHARSPWSIMWKDTKEVGKEVIAQEREMLRGRFK